MVNPNLNYKDFYILPITPMIPGSTVRITFAIHLI